MKAEFYDLKMYYVLGVYYLNMNIKYEMKSYINFIIKTLLLAMLTYSNGNNHTKI